MALAHACGSSDGPEARIDGATTDGPPGAACLAPKQIIYTTPGCGAEAIPRCEIPNGDACSMMVCLCDGVTTSGDGCGFSHEPFLYTGFCKKDAALTADAPIGGDVMSEVAADTPSQSDTPTVDAPDAAIGCGLHDGRRFPVGSVFSDGCGCCNCASDGAVCYGGNVCTRPVDGGYQSLMSLPPCRSDSDCAAMIGAEAVCVFDPGCSPGQGRCVGSPSTTCSTYTADIAHDYCGCDGMTFHVGVSGAKSYPDRPYTHLGPCP